MNDLQKYEVLDTSLTMTIAVMRDLFDDNYLEWKDEMAKAIYIDLLNVVDKVWEQKRKLKGEK